MFQPVYPKTANELLFYRATLPGRVLADRGVGAQISLFCMRLLRRHEPRRS
jgi:hypothetical protein